MCNREAHTYVTWTLLSFVSQPHGLTLLLIFQVVEIIGGQNDVCPQVFSLGATAPPPRSTPLHSTEEEHLSLEVTICVAFRTPFPCDHAPSAGVSEGYEETKHWGGGGGGGESHCLWTMVCPPPPNASFTHNLPTPLTIRCHLKRLYPNCVVY